MKLYLYEGLNKQDRASVMLWESAGRKLVEAQLTADQITQLFQQIQTAKNNRTLVGKGVDAGSAVMKAYNDLKTKISTSGPIQNMDALYDQAAEKLKQATGGDQGAMSYVQKYRDFAKKHPVAQSFIYGALIAAAGISGAGAGGAAALGLFKMVDKLLQGEKFSSAAYSGAKTGAMAYAAGQIGKAVRGDQAQQAASAAGGMDADQTELAKYILKYYSPEEFDYVPSGTNINVVSKATGQLMANYDVSDVGLFPDEFLAGINKLVAADPSAALGSAASTAARTARDAAFDAEYPNFESRNLSRKQVQAIFERVALLNSRMLSEGRLEEGIWDDIKSGAGKGLQGIKSLAGKAAGAVAQGAAKVGRSMTAKVSSDALTKAWQAAGSPTDSAEIEKLLQAQGVNPEVVKTVFQANSIPLSVAAAASTGSAGVDANEPMPDVISTNRAETPTPAEPATASAGPGAQVAQQQAPQQTIQQPASAEPTAGLAGQGAMAQGVQQAQVNQQAQSQQQQPSATASKLPDVTRLTPEQKKQLLAQIDKQLASMPAAIAQQPTPPAPQPPVATAPTQSATAAKMPAPTTPVATTQQAVAAKMPVATKTAKPKVPYSAIAQKAQPAKVSAARNPGAPTDAEYNKFQDLLKQALDKQGA
jgi:hypothetical protein